EKGDVAGGLHWMVEALKLVPDDDVDGQLLIRTHLAAWLRHSHALRSVKVNYAHALRPAVPNLDPVLFARPEIATPASLAAVGKAVAISPDQRVALMSNQQLYDVKTAKPLGMKLQHPFGINQAQFAPDGRTIMTLGEEGITRWW